MEQKSNLPELDGASTRSSGMEPEPCYCQSQGRYATECLRWGECTQREHSREPNDAPTTWRGPEPPHVYRRDTDTVRTLAVVRDIGADPCKGSGEMTFCARHGGRCAFSNEGQNPSFGDMWLEAHQQDDKQCVKCGDDIERVPPTSLPPVPEGTLARRPPDPPMCRHVDDKTYATFSGQRAGPRCKRPSMDACVDCGGETCALGCPTRLPDNA